MVILLMIDKQTNKYLIKTKREHRKGGILLKFSTPEFNPVSE